MQHATNQQACKDGTAIAATAAAGADIQGMYEYTFSNQNAYKILN